MREDFQIGDVVRIRDWDDMEAEFGVDRYGDIKCTSTFTSAMEYLCGEEFTITEMKTPSMCLEYEQGMVVGRTDGYTISTDMIERLDVKEREMPSELLDFLKGFE